MMNLLKPRHHSLCFKIFIVFSLLHSSAQAGWEVSGGDTYALQFVKIGRLIAEELPKHPACPLNSKINFPNFTQSIETEEVSTANEDSPSTETKIHLNRLTWRNLTMRKKLEIVLKAYTRNSATPFTGSIDLDTETKCEVSLEWKKAFEATVPEDNNQDLAVSQNVGAMARKLLNRLSSAPDSSVLKRFSYCKLEVAIENTHLDGVELKPSHSNCSKGEKSKAISINTAPLALKFADNQLKDGLNLKNKDSAVLVINRSVWRTLSDGQKMELLLHEYLNVIGSPDHHYQISSLLFHDIPLADYR
jgi:hypothetical protein